MGELLRVRVCDLLYRTRGRDWDYAFLLQPPAILGEGWYTLHRRIFQGVEPTSTPLLLRGALGIGTGHAFFATAFADAERRDSQDRAIAHYLAWLGQSAEDAPGWSFGPAVVAALRPALDAVFDLGPERLLQHEGQPLDRLLRERFSAALQHTELSVSCALSSNVRWLGRLAV